MLSQSLTDHNIEGSVQIAYTAVCNLQGLGVVEHSHGSDKKNYSF